MADEVTTGSYDRKEIRLWPGRLVGMAPGAMIDAGRYGRASNWTPAHRNRSYGVEKRHPQ